MCFYFLYSYAGSDSDVVKLYDLTSLCDEVSSTVLTSLGMWFKFTNMVDLWWISSLKHASKQGRGDLV